MTGPAHPARGAQDPPPGAPDNLCHFSELTVPGPASAIMFPDPLLTQGPPGAGVTETQ